MGEPSIVIDDEAAQVKAASLLIRAGKAEVTDAYLDAVQNQADVAMGMLIPNTRMTLLAGEAIPVLVAETRKLRSRLEAIEQAEVHKKAVEAVRDAGLDGQGGFSDPPPYGDTSGGD